MNEAVLKEEVLKVYESYMQGFKNSDTERINSIINFPIAILKDGSVEQLDYYPVNPEQLRMEKEWHHSSDWKFDVTAINEHNAHINASAVRRRADGSFIEKVSAFYGFSKINGAWKMCSLSEIVS